MTAPDTVHARWWPLACSLGLASAGVATAFAALRLDVPAPYVQGGPPRALALELTRAPELVAFLGALALLAYASATAAVVRPRSPAFAAATAAIGVLLVASGAGVLAVLPPPLPEEEFVNTASDVAAFAHPRALHSLAVLAAMPPIALLAIARWRAIGVRRALLDPGLSVALVFLVLCIDLAWMWRDWRHGSYDPWMRHACEIAIVALAAVVLAQAVLTWRRDRRA